EGRGFFQDLPLLAQHPHLTAQRPQLLALLARQAGALTSIYPGLANPQTQRLRGDAQVPRDLLQRATTRSIQLDSLTPKLRRVRLLEVRSPWHGGRSSLPGRTLPTKRSGVHENGGTPRLV